LAAREAERAAPARRDGDVLLSVHHVRHGPGHRAGSDGRLPELLAVARAIGDEAPVGGALEEQVVADRERAAGEARAGRMAPDLALVHRIPREQIGTPGLRALGLAEVLE